MSERNAIMAAEIDNWPTKSALAEMFRSEGYAVTQGRFSVRLTDFDNFVFRELGGDLQSGSISADSESTDRLIAFASRVSETLKIHSVRHRFEVYSEIGEMAAYLHHDWPREL